MSSIKGSEVLIGKIYRLEYPSESHVIAKCLTDGNPYDMTAVWVDIDTKRLCFDKKGSFCAYHSIYEATAEEKNWLEACIKVGRALAKDSINNQYETF